MPQDGGNDVSGLVSARLLYCLVGKLPFVFFFFFSAFPLHDDPSAFGSSMACQSNLVRAILALGDLAGRR